MDKSLSRKVLHAAGYLGTHHCQTFLRLKYLQCTMKVKTTVGYLRTTNSITHVEGEREWRGGGGEDLHFAGLNFMKQGWGNVSENEC